MSRQTPQQLITTAGLERPAPAAQAAQQIQATLPVLVAQPQPVIVPAAMTHTIRRAFFTEVFATD